jgi:hypothetical protein
VTVAASVVPDSEGAEASLRDVLAAALDAHREMARLAAELREENGRLREENTRLRAEGAEQAAELERVRADLAVLQRMVFGRSSERARPEPSADGEDAGQGRDLRGSGTGGKKRRPGARAGRRLWYGQASASPVRRLVRTIWSGPTWHAGCHHGRSPRPSAMQPTTVQRDHTVRIQPSALVLADRPTTFDLCHQLWIRAAEVIDTDVSKVARAFIS